MLLFSKTAGFRHDSIADGIATLQSLGAANNFVITATEDAAQFNEPNLRQFRCVVFLSTTGDVLDEEQQAAFGGYIRRGGGFVGIHAASDTEYNWPWYGRLVGAYFKSHPAIQSATITVNDSVHPSTAELPKRWTRTDEWYVFQANPRAAVHVLATLDENSYAPADRMGFDHPIAWCHLFDGGRAWYTGGGHTRESFAEPLFRQHVLGGILWAAGIAEGDAGATIDANFQKTVLDDAPQFPMQMSIASDGRVFFVERLGAVKIWKPETGMVVRAGVIPVDWGREDGLLGIALDPGFATNHWAYLFYTSTTAAEQHVSRFTIVGDSIDLGSEKLLLRIPIQKVTCCHSGGGLEFGPDGNLFIATGDNTNPFQSDGFAPIDERAGREPWDAQKASSNANDLRGKILRIHPQPDGTYTIPTGNLFAPGTADTRPEIYTMGHRNPFRFSVDAETGFLYWGEVGPDAGEGNALRGPAGHDEWNQARTAGNYGWPYFVADNKPYRDFDFATQMSGIAYDPAAPVNDSPSNTGPRNLPPARAAWIWYPYTPSLEFPEVNHPSIFWRCAMAGPVFHHDSDAPGNGRRLPAYYDKTLILYDWARNHIKEVKLDDTGALLKINPLLPTFTWLRPIDIKIGPDGAIYMIEWGADFGGGPGAKLSRIDYIGGNQLAVLQSALDAAGPYADEFAVAFDETTQSFEMTVGEGARYFRVRSTRARSIGETVRDGERLRITLE